MKKEYISPEVEVFYLVNEDMIAQSVTLGGDNDYADPDEGFEELSQKKRRYAWENQDGEGSSSFWK